MDLCRSAPLHELPAERIRGEWEKLFLRAPHPSKGWALAQQAQILERVFPAAQSAQPPAVAQVLDRLANDLASDAPGPRMTQMLAGWLAQGSPDAVTASLDVLGLHRMGRFDVRTHTLSLVAHHADPLHSDTDLRTLATHTRVDWVLTLRRALDPGFDPAPVQARAAALGVLTEALPPLLQGRDLAALGIPPGPHMGTLLRAIYQAQLQGRLPDREAAIHAVTALWERGAE